MNWRVIYKQFEEGNKINGITLEYLMGYDTVASPLYRVVETVGNYQFEMLRLQTSKRKITISDDLGLIGFNSLDLSDNYCYLTEGVSDFMSKKLMLKTQNSQHQNVLGIVTLGGNTTAKKILASLFDNYEYCADNDITGINQAKLTRSWLLSLGKSVRVTLPEAGCKDVSEQYCKLVGYGLRNIRKSE